MDEPACVCVACMDVEQNASWMLCHVSLACVSLRVVAFMSQIIRVRLMELLNDTEDAAMLS